jgi:hypothetical protein
MDDRIAVFNYKEQDLSEAKEKYFSKYGEIHFDETIQPYIDNGIMSIFDDTASDYTIFFVRALADIVRARLAKDKVKELREKDEVKKNCRKRCPKCNAETHEIQWDGPFWDDGSTIIHFEGECDLCCTVFEEVYEYSFSEFQDKRLEWDLISPLQRANILSANGVSDDAAYEIANREFDYVPEEWKEYFKEE